MKKLLIISAILFFAVDASAQSAVLKYPFSISFRSICCGVPPDSGVISYIKTFKKKYRLKSVSYDRIGPLGKEGEYDMDFTMKEFSGKQKTAFIAGMKTVLKKIKASGHAIPYTNITVDMSSLGRASRETIKL